MRFFLYVAAVVLTAMPYAMAVAGPAIRGLP